jgi:iron-sulfur cluster assembly protein
METLINTPVTLTQGALEAVRRIREEDQTLGPEHCLRVGVKGGGCSGMSYVLAFDLPTEHDDRFDLGGIPVVLDRRHALYVSGMEVDYQDGLNARGFVFRNPNAKETCGCGTSFSA